MKNKANLSDATFDAWASQKEFLISCEGMKGYGVYHYMQAFLLQSPGNFASFSDLGRLARRMCTKKAFVLRVVTDYGLFVIKDDKFYSVANPVRTSVSKPVCTSISTSVTKPVRTSGEKCISLESSEIQNRKTTPPHVRTRISVVDGIFISDKNNNNNKTKTREAKAEKPSSTSLVDQLLTDTAWLKELWKSTGMEEANFHQLPQLMDRFKSHIRLYGKESELTDLKSVKQYLTNYLSADSRTGKKVREDLVSLHPEPPKEEVPLDPYRFEELTDGKRTFMGGIPIPDDAPPRPTHLAFWDYCNLKWLT